MNDFDNKQICSYKDIDRFGFTCDVCGRKVNGCHYINGMSFCEKCYQETFGKDNQQNEIQQLKQQLEEKDKLLKCYQEEEKLIADILGDKDLTIIGSRVHLKNLIVELKNKIKDKDIVIEEKDKEIERLKVFEKAYYFNQTQVSQESMDLLLQNAYQVHNETQLAIQELEKVKNYCDKQFNLWENNNFNETYDNTDVSHAYFEIAFIIKEKIKELKGE